MNIVLWLIFIIVAIISFLPLVRIDLFSVSKKYSYFKYLSMTLVAWSLILGAAYVIQSGPAVYYLAILMYPVIFSATGLTFLSIAKFLKRNPPNYIKYLMIIFFIIEVIFAATNASHRLFLDIGLSDAVTHSQMTNAPIGVFFYIHTIVCYSFLIISFIMISTRLYTTMKEEEDYFPFYLLVVSIILGIIINLVHVFIITFTLDPTYVFYVLITGMLYFVFYIRDVRLILKLSNHQFILENLREMYMVVNQKQEVVGASKELLERFDLELKSGASLKDFMDKISLKAYVYSDSEAIEHSYDKSKDYFHSQTKDIKIPFYKYNGHLILLYDETKIQKYIHDMDYIMNHDLMTELYNRNYFETFRNSLESKENYAFMLIDLDGLKLFNDYLGHREGDKLLINFADTLKTFARNDSDIVPIRVGGDEFLLIMFDKSVLEIEQIIKEMKRVSHKSDPLKSIGFSYGYSISENALTTEQVLSKADREMYHMKMTRQEEKKELENILKKKSIYNQTMID